MSRPELAVEHKILRIFQRLKKGPRSVLLAVSGGRDSIVMAEVLWRWRVGLKLDLKVGHVHHGPSANPVQRAYRDRTQEFVRAWAAEHHLEFFTNAGDSAPTLKSEQSLREFRDVLLAEWAAESGAAVALAHHQEDLLETRLLRLIRGSGPQGLRSMCVYRRGKLRPLLPLSVQNIQAYAEARGLSWIEDPSNTEVHHLRNWMRQRWLPILEEKRPGSLASLARSLESIAPSSSAQDLHLAPYVGLRREVFASRSVQQQRALLAAYLKNLGLKGYARTHVDEILKRLSTGRKQQAFEMLGMRFNISPDFLWASRV